MSSTPDQAHIEAVSYLYDRGLYIQAWQRALEAAPLENWRGPRAAVTAFRLVGNLGDQALGTRLTVRARRELPEDPEVACYFAYASARYRGPWETLEFMDGFAWPESARPATSADWLAHRATQLSFLRDFGGAHEALERALRLAPGRAWILIEKSRVLEEEDRVEEALETAREALRMRPDYRPGIQRLADLLVMNSRHDEAVDLLENASGRLESFSISIQLGILEKDARRYERARAAWLRASEHAILADRRLRDYLNSQLADTAWLKGDLESARTYGRTVKDEYWSHICEKMERAGPGDTRVHLPVPFVRQDHRTCGSATLAALARYWKVPLRHADIVAEIHYGGTTSLAERDWAHAHGFVAREFKVTWEAARALLDRGVPFAVASVFPEGAHLQAVIGYDSRRDTLLLREPSEGTIREPLAPAFLGAGEDTGPRGMVLLPQAEVHRLKEIALPEAEAYDLLHGLARCLRAQDREGAYRLEAALTSSWPDTSATFHARLTLARHDQNAGAELRVVEEALKRHPRSLLLHWFEYLLLQELGSREDRLETLAAARALAPRHPVFTRLTAMELASDVRERPGALRQIRRALRDEPPTPGTFSVLARLLQSFGNLKDAFRAWLVASRLNSTHEDLAQSAWEAALAAGCEDLALAHLRGRLAAARGKSSAPARTLFFALEQLRRTEEGFKVLEAAMEDRPDEGIAKLFAAEQHARRGRHEKASALVRAARGQSADTLWHRITAIVHSLAGRHRECLAEWRALLALSPADVQAQVSVARLLLGLEGRPAAQAHLDEAGRKMPRHLGLARERLQFAEGDGPAVQEAIALECLRTHPDDPWIWRQLAMSVSQQGRQEEALAAAGRAREIAADECSTWNVLGDLHLQAGRHEEAREAFRRAVEISPQNGFGIARLVELSSGTGNKEGIEWVFEKLLAARSAPDGIRAFAVTACHALPLEAALQYLQSLLQRHEGDHIAWSCVLRHLMTMGRQAEAADLVRRALERFPHESCLHLDSAKLASLRNDAEGEISALREACRLDPGGAAPSLELGSALLRHGRPAEARDVLERTSASVPDGVEVQSAFASALLRSGEVDRARGVALRAAELRPASAQVWEVLGEIERRAGPPRLREDTVRRLAADRPFDPGVWEAMLNVLEGPDALPEQIDAARRVTVLRPAEWGSWDMLAWALIEAGRLDEALEACAPACLQAVPPELRGRRALIKAMRGQLGSAITEMRQILAEAPTFERGWHWMADWCQRAGQLTEYFAAADRLVLLAPRSAMALGMRCEARLRLAWGERGAAKETSRRLAREDLARAIVLDPAYRYAALEYVTLCIADGDAGEARRWTESLPADAPRLHVAINYARLAAHTRDAVLAARTLATLWEVPTMDEEDFRAIVAGLQTSRQHGQLRRLLDETGAGRPMTPVLARIAMTLVCRARDTAQADALLAQSGQPESVWPTLASTWMEETARQAGKMALLRFLNAHRERLRAREETWSAASTALVDCNEWNELVKWTNDWETLPAAPASTLRLRALVLLRLRRWAEAAVVARAAVARALPAEKDQMAVCCSFATALAGDGAGACAVFPARMTSKLTQFDQCVAFLAQALCALEEPSRPGSPGAFARARGFLTSCERAVPQWKDSGLLEAYHTEAVNRIARWRGGIVGFCWRILKHGTLL